MITGDSTPFGIAVKITWRKLAGQAHPILREAFSSTNLRPMQYNPQNPIIVQGDKSVLLEVNNPLCQEARDILSRFAELEKSPEYIHTYRISPLSLWNAASAGLAAEAIVAGLAKYSKYPLPGNVEVDIREYIGRYGRVRLTRRNNDLLLTSDDKPLILELLRRKELKGYILNVSFVQLAAKS